MKTSARIALGGVALVLSTLMACHGSTRSEHRMSSASTSGSTQPHTAERRGVLVTYLHGIEIGREEFVDDGQVLRSEILFNARHVRVALQRSPRHVRVEVNGTVTERDLPNGTVAVENGQWSALAFAAEGFESQSSPAPVTFILPSNGATVPATLSVERLADGTRRVHLTVGPTESIVTVNAAGVVTRGEVPSQQLEVLPEGIAATRPAGRPAPAGIDEEAVEVLRNGVPIRGVLWRPANANGPMPVVLFVAGSGPTDRDGNQPPALQTDTYRMLAEGLAQRGIASARFDKRGVGQSGRNFVVADLTVQDLVADTAAWVERLRHDARFRSVWVAGHSEGGLLALMLPPEARVDGLILLATAGRPFGALVREQLARQFDAIGMAEVDRLLGAVRENRPLEGVQGPLRALFNPTVARYLRSELDVDPVALLRARHEPTTVIQGDYDAQVTVHDAELLAAARPGITLRRFAHANHLFKEETSAALPQASYTDPSRPLVDGVVAAVATPILAVR